MEIRIKETGELVSEQQFRAMFPSTGFPAQLTEQVINDFGGEVVLEGPQAQPTRYQIAYRDGVEQIEGKWFTKYSVADMDQEARDALDLQQAKNIREQRNQKLSETDWRFRTDMNPSQEWKDYCQALRDVTLQEGFPWDINWPKQPE